MNRRQTRTNSNFNIWPTSTPKKSKRTLSTCLRMTLSRDSITITLFQQVRKIQTKRMKMQLLQEVHRETQDTAIQLTASFRVISTSLEATHQGITMACLQKTVSAIQPSSPRQTNQVPRLEQQKPLRLPQVRLHPRQLLQMPRDKKCPPWIVSNKFSKYLNKPGRASIVSSQEDQAPV